MTRIRDLLCKTCKSSASRSYCGNCQRAVEKLFNKRRLHTLEANKLRNEKMWLSASNEKKRILIRAARMTIEELANLDVPYPKPVEQLADLAKQVNSDDMSRLTDFLKGK